LPLLYPAADILWRVQTQPPIESFVADRLRARRRIRVLGGGIEGNARLTAITAVALVALLLVEGVTIVDLSPLISVHLFVGLLLIPPVGLKLASTGYRFARYYTGSPAYVRKGPPHPILRSIAPVVILTSVVMLASGVWLLLAGPRVRDTVLPIHKVSFIVWGIFTGVHVLGHLIELPSALDADYGRDHRRAALAQGRIGRELALLGALVAGVALALLLRSHFGAWEHWRRV
jgi:hypothetical protein